MSIDFKTKKQFKDSVLKEYSTMMQKIYLNWKEYGSNDILRISVLQVLNQHVAEKTCAALRRKVRPSTKVKNEVRLNIEKQMNGTQEYEQDVKDLSYDKDLHILNGDN